MRVASERETCELLGLDTSGIKNYVVYHLHSMLSNGTTNVDSVTKYEDYINLAHELGMTSIGFSEHGNVFEHIKKRQMCESLGIKYIHGEEFYVTEKLVDDEDKKIRDNYHVVIIAKNYDGYLELNRLSSQAFNRSNVKSVDDNERFYYYPRITFDELVNTSDNLIITTACLGGILHKGYDELQNRFIKFLSDNRHRCFLEIQHHNHPDQIDYNKKLGMISCMHDIRLIAGTDTHCLNEKHEKGRKILQISKNIHFEDEDGWDLTFKSYEELCKCYAIQDSLPEEDYLRAIENTNLMADMVEEYHITNEYKYPHLWKDPEILLKKKIEEGFIKRGCDKFENKDEYLKRAEYEYNTYKNNDMTEFMLLATDMIEYCNEHGIQVGYGRGSVNGSVVAWMLGITEMDSIKHNLNFERFANPERQSLADVDTDFPSNRRNEVKQYLFNREGLRCCDIITFNTIALRGAIRDVARALEIPLSEVGAICDLAEKDREKAAKLYPELMEYVDIVEGTVVSVGVHPCLLAGSKVLTIDGYKNIEDITEDDYVFTHNNRYKKVNSVMRSKKNGWCKVKAIGAMDINCTTNHPILVRKRLSKRIYKLESSFSEPEWVNAGDIKPGDAIAIPKNTNSIIPKIDGCDLPFESESFWWICGRYLGDGYTVDIKRGENWIQKSIYICHGRNDDSAHLIYEKLDECGVEYTIKHGRTAEEITFKASSRDKWGMFLRKFGKHAHNKCIPNEVLDLPTNLLASFIEGYLSADGSNYKNCTEFCSTSIGIALGMSMCINKVYDVHCTYKYRSARDSVIEGRTVHCKESYHVAFTKNPSNKFYFSDNKYIWSFVRKVDYFDEEIDTYNLSVFDDNSYTVNNVAVHNCGCVVSDLNIEETFGLCTTSTSEYPVSQIYMKEIDSLNYVKLDLLCLDTIQLINDTCKLIGIERFTPDNIDVSDENVWKSIRDDTTGIFQWESDMAQTYIKKILSEETISKFESEGYPVDKMMMLTIGNGAIRPAGASYREDLANGVVKKTGCKAIDECMASTFGYCVFQCQIIEFLHKCCGFTMGEADIVRRGFAKKTGTEQFIPIIKDGGYLTDSKEHFIKGFICTMKDDYGYDEEFSEKVIVDFIKVIEDASSYLFSINHSQPYSYEGYVSGYLRYYYPYEFITTALNICSDNADKTAEIVKYANKVGIRIMSPKWGVSGAGYHFNKEKKAIAKGLSSVKYMSSGLADELDYVYSLNKDATKFMDILPFLNENTSLNSRQLEILIKIDFFSEFGNQRELLRMVDIFYNTLDRGNASKISKAKAEASPIEDIIAKYSNNRTKAGTIAKSYTILDMNSIIREVEDKVKSVGMEDLGDLIKVQNFKEYMGYVGYVSDKQEDRPKLFVTHIYPLHRKKDGKQFGYSIITKSIGSGKESRFTVFNNVFDKDPIKENDIIYCKKFETDGQYFTLKDYTHIYA